jgi:hypothetical protein
LTLRPVIASSPTSGNILAIIDTKTKNGTRTIVSVSREYKIQLMLYKKLLDGLLSPTFNWSQFFKSKGVDSSRSFSDAFRAQLINIVETNKLDTSIHGVTTLEDLRKPWIVAVQALNLMSDQTDQELTIVYRKPGKLFKCEPILSMACYSNDRRITSTNTTRKQGKLGYYRRKVV